MSYPPRPPMGLPGMPNMMHQGYGYPPIGMMPMGMMPMMPQVPSSTQQNKYNKKFVPQDIPPKSNEDGKAPVTTVFVGNISERAPDTMIRQMLQRCGNVLSWKRVQGASGKLQAFGFCEYEDPDATLRCIRLLNEWKIADKNLVVKVDAKTKAQLDEWKKKKWREKHKPTTPQKNKEAAKDEEPEEGETKESDDEDQEAIDSLDEFTLREDRVAKAGLDAIMREYHSDLARSPPLSSEYRQEQIEEEKKRQMRMPRLPTDGPKDLSLEDMELDHSTKELINKEIKSFRDAHKDEDPADKEREKERERERIRRILEREERERRDRERERERERERKERDKEKRRERTRTRSRSKSKSRDRDQEILDEEEEYERRKLERKLRDKEAQYQELLTKWEARERKKEREYDKEKERDRERKNEESKEARRLKEFFEDYDDERDDPKYYKGSALQRRLKEREKEMESDERDRQREKEEIEELRRKMLEDGHPEVEAEIAKLESEKDAHLMPRLNQTRSRSRSRSVSKGKSVSSRSSSSSSSSSRSRSRSRGRSRTQSESSNRRKSQDSQKGIIIPDADSSDNELPSPGGGDDTRGSWVPANGHEPQPVLPPAHSSTSLHKNTSASNSPQETSAANKRKKLTASDVFNQDDDEGGDAPKKRKLVPIDYGDDAKSRVKSKPISLPMAKPQTAEEKRKCIKNLIEKIPTAKDELFAYPLDWNMVDSTLMDRRIRPWVNKKIMEYIGDEEPTLSNFICEKVMTHSPPTTILADIAMVFDEEAEVFVVKMWRLLIYETEAKKLGLVK